METTEQPSKPLASNNPYRSERSTSEEVLRKEQQQSRDSEKQVVSSEMSSGASNAPMVSPSDDTSPIPVAEPEHEAGKEVMSSWQTQSKEENAPIPLNYHESRIQPTGELLNDIKGEPPAYETLTNNQRTRSDNDGLITSPTSIEPDNKSPLPARPEDRSTVGQLLSWIPASPRISIGQLAPLIQTVIIPQLDIPPQGESVPFKRCYSEALASHDVPMSEFLSFIDGLAVAQAPNSALQGLKMFGVGVKQVPLPFIPLAGTGISKLASSGSGHSGSRARLYLERARKEYFAPRGLNMTVVKDGDLNTRLGIPGHASRLAPLTKNSLTDSCSERRLNALTPYVAPLRFNVPEPDRQLQGVHKLARKHLEGQFRSKAKKVTKLREKQWEDINAAGPEAREWEEEFAFKTGQLRRMQDDIVREQKLGKAREGPLREMVETLQQLQRELQLLETQRYMAVQHQAGASKGVEAEMEETNLAMRLKWIVIENLPV